jgi:histidyl-tRNA synthetase
MNNLSTQPYKGTRDYYPEDKAVQNYIFDTWRRVVTSYGYREYGTPVLEPLDLYTAKSGEELAGEQTYQFTDRGDRVVAIRPEMTPSVSRLVAGRRQELAYPAKLFSIANFMRYERPQKGREREFWQLNVDSFGDEGVAADADILKLADNLLKAFGASNDQYVIKVNDRRLINEVMSSYLGFDSESSSQAIKLLDRKNKLTEDEFKSQVANILGDDKIEKLQALADTRSVEHLPSEVSTGEHASYIQNLLELLGAIGVESVWFAGLIITPVWCSRSLIQTPKTTGRYLVAGATTAWLRCLVLSQLVRLVLLRATLLRSCFYAHTIYCPIFRPVLMCMLRR